MHHWPCLPSWLPRLQSTVPRKTSRSFSPNEGLRFTPPPGHSSPPFLHPHRPPLPQLRVRPCRRRHHKQERVAISSSKLPRLLSERPIRQQLTRNLRLRQAAGNDNLGAVLTQVTQNNPVTTNWVESTNDITTTWVEVIYTQTFASVVEQRETAGAGSVGLGTITGEVGVVRSSAGAIIIPAGSFITVALGAFGVLAGVGMVLL